MIPIIIIIILIGTGGTSDLSGEETATPEKSPLAEPAGADGLGASEPR